MKKGITIGVITGIILSIVYSIWGYVILLPSKIQIPEGAVIAFNSESCPKVGWSEYKLAHGKFIRGIDNSNKKTDPDRVRRPGNIQSSATAAHDHSTYFVLNGHPKDSGDRQAGKKNYIIHSSYPKGTKGYVKTTSAGSGGKETRPANVALLYCEKTK